MKIDLSRRLVDLKGIKLVDEDETVSVVLANIFGTRQISDISVVKTYDWARQLIADKSLEIDRVDRDKVIMALDSVAMADIPGMFRAQIVLALKEDMVLKLDLERELDHAVDV